MKTLLSTCKTMLIASFIFLGMISKSYAQPFQIQILHASDFEGGLSASTAAPNFAAILDSLENTYPNTLILSSGDNFIPSPFSLSGEDISLVTPLKNAYISFYGSNFANNDLRAGIARPDISILNFLGVEASVLGNHDFDFGTSELRNIIAGASSGTAIRWFGAQFPYLSSNLDFSADPNLSNLFESTRKQNTFFRSNPSQTAAQITATKKLASSTIIIKNGVKIGIVGVTTPILAAISSPGFTTIKNPGAGTENMALLATIVQPVIDSLILKEGINKIILLAHLQQLSNEKTLATFLNGVDIIVGGGSNTLMADAGDRLQAGDVAAENYPFFTTGADGNQTIIVNTDGEYKYVGRLVLDFDSAGNVIPSSIDPAISGAFAADTLGVTDLYGNYSLGFTSGSKGALVRSLCAAIANVIVAKDGNTFGRTNVFLEGQRNFVRTQETNLGSLTADVNLWQARQVIPDVKVSIKNGGGIRSSIGVIRAVGSVVEYLPPAANPQVGKQEGEISQLDIENALRFNNRLSVVNSTPAGLKNLLEHGVSLSGPGQTQGRFPQIGGLKFSYNVTLAAQSRILNVVLTDENGNTVDTVVKNGMIFGNPTRVIKIVTLNFLASGGDGYPFAANSTGRRDLDTLITTPGVATFSVPGTEQDALAEYLSFFHDPIAFNKAETPASLDERIQETTVRPDCILVPVVGNIIGNGTACVANQANTISFNVIPVDNAVTYTWSIPTGLTIVSGQGTTTINLSYTKQALVEGINGKLVVDVRNGCNEGSESSLEININQTVPFMNGTIFGRRKVCPGTFTSYSLQVIRRAKNYVWTLPAGMTIVDGINTNRILVEVDAAYNGGTISAITNNACGNSTSRSISVSRLNPTRPSVINGPASVCPGQTNLVYSVDSVIGQTYTWTVPATAILVSGQGTKNITVSFNNVSAFNQRIQVFASNGCGNSTMLSSGNINIDPNFCGRSAKIETLNIESEQISIYPNPAKSLSTIVFNSENESNYVLNIMDISGRKVSSITGKTVFGENKVEINLSELASGLYQIEVLNNNKIERGKLIVQQ